MPSSGSLEKDIAPKLLQVYIKRYKDVSVLHSLLIQSLQLLIMILLIVPIDPPLPTVEMDTSASSDFDLPIAH